MARITRIIVAIGVLGALVVLYGVAAITPDASGAPSVSSYTALEDTFVKSSRPDRVYGADTTLQADISPSIKRSLVRFQVAGLPEGVLISSATFRMYVVDPSSTPGAAHGVDGGWSEAITTWSNAPAVGATLADFTGPATKGLWVEADVTQAVSGNGLIDFYVLTSSSNGVDFMSREGGAQPPTLVLRWSVAADSAPLPAVTATPAPTAVPAPTPTPTPSDTGSQPQPPIRAAFFYPWFSEAWSQHGVFPYTNYTPKLGFYASKDDAVIDQQLRLAETAHLDAFVASWWGPGHHTDTALQHIISRSERSDSPYPSLRWSVYYELESLGDPTPSQIASDLRYLTGTVFAHPGYLKVDGRPVVFVYADAADGAGMARRWAKAKASLGGDVYTVLKVYSGYRTDPNQPDSWHQYGPATAYDAQFPYSVTVSPGFWKWGEAPRLARDPARFEADVQRMAASGAFWQLVTTWNEWGEGTSVEPAAEFGDTYIGILCRNLPGTADCVFPSLPPTPAPTPTPTPQPAPLPVPGGDSTSGSAAFPAAEDTFVKSTRPDSNYGSSSRLEADASPSVKRALIRFQVAGIPEGAAIVSAKLRMLVVDGSSYAGDVHSVQGAWSESGTAWSTAPPIGGKLAAFPSPAVAGGWAEADVASAVPGNGAVEFYVTTPSDNGVDFGSRESGSSRPVLVVRWSSGSVTPAPVPSSGGGDPVLVGAGDIASCGGSGDEATAALLDDVVSQTPDAIVFTAGDNVYDSGTAAEFANCYGPSWGRHLARTRPSVGNHEYSTPGASGYFGYFGTAAGDPAKGYYSYDLGGWHVVVLNSNCSQAGGCAAGSPQERWLRADLAAHPAQCTIAYWHHPLFSSGQHGGDPSVRVFWQALYDFGADLVVNGHDHDYERFAPQDPAGAGDAARGIRQFVAGMGGRSHYATANPIANSEVRNSDTFGVLKLTLRAGAYDWEFIPQAGKTFRDSGSEHCR